MENERMAHNKWFEGYTKMKLLEREESGKFFVLQFNCKLLVVTKESTPNEKWALKWCWYRRGELSV